MKTKLTRIHLGLGLADAGVQFETLDATDVVTSTQRAFLADPPPEVTAPLWAWARAMLDAKIATLPIDLPPAAVTSALMRMHDAEAVAARARAQKLELDEQIAKGQAERDRLASEIVSATAALEGVRAELLRASEPAQGGDPPPK